MMICNIKRRSAPSFTGPLDSFSANLRHASDYRRLLGSYTGPLIRVKRSSDNAEQDIGYTSGGDLDTTALASFVNSNSAYVVKVYDQSGNGTDLVGAGTNGGFRIVNAGTNETLNSRVVGKASSSNATGYATATFTSYTGATLTAIGTFFCDTFDNADRLYSVVDTGSDTEDADVAAIFFVTAPDFPHIMTYRNGFLSNTVSAPEDAVHGISARFTGTNAVLVSSAGSNSAASSANWNFTSIRIGSQAVGDYSLNVGSAFPFTGLWLADIGSTNAETIRAESDTYWST